MRQANKDPHEVENQYSRVVTREGNRRAKDEASQSEPREQFERRGLGLVHNRGIKLTRRAIRRGDAFCDP
ncbi:hypothetical protein [Bradyrhizobium sp. NBAIM01]|uniref:hypothetical protein n=1 Tax=Bradyrhizobium sp. NBAIM01 TaxID=2793818 RepID=UPI003208F8ED